MPKDGTATRERILETAERLMVEQGYRATSLDQVISDASTSKGAFFHHFASKADLARQLTQRYVDSDIANLNDALDATADIVDPAERLIAFVRLFEDRGDDLMSVQSGCLYATVLAEREFNGDDVNALVAKGAVEWRTALTELIRPALAARSVAPDVDADALADHLYVTFEGGFILCRTLQDPSAMRAQLRTFRVLLEALFAGKRAAKR